MLGRILTFNVLGAVTLRVLQDRVHSIPNQIKSILSNPEETEEKKSVILNRKHKNKTKQF